MRSIQSSDRVDPIIKHRQHDFLKSNPLAITLKSPSLMSSEKHPSCRLRDSEVQDSEALSSEQFYDPSIAPIADLKQVLEGQRGDIDRIMANVSNLQQNIISLRKLAELLSSRRYQTPHDDVSDVDVPVNSMTNISSRVSELGTLKLGTKIMQQRIKRLEESISQGWLSSPNPGSSQASRRLSPATEKQAPSHIDASLNGTLFPVNQMPIIGSASRGSHTPIQTPPLQSSRKGGPEWKDLTCRSLNARSVATHRTAPMLITDPLKRKILSRHISPTEGASTGSQQVRQEDSDYNDELVDDIRPHPSTGSSTGKYWHKTAHPRQTQASENAPQPSPKFKIRQSVPIPLPVSDPSSVNRPARGRPAHRDSKRRKTTVFESTTSSTSIRPADQQASDPGSGRRVEQRLFVVIKGEIDGRSALFRNLEGQGRKRPRECEDDYY